MLRKELPFWVSLSGFERRESLEDCNFEEEEEQGGGRKDEIEREWESVTSEVSEVLEE